MSEDEKSIFKPTAIEKHVEEIQSTKSSVWQWIINFVLSSHFPKSCTLGKRVSQKASSDVFINQVDNQVDNPLLVHVTQSSKVKPIKTQIKK